MDYISRETCCISERKDLEVLHCIKDFPVYMGTTKQEISSDLTLDLEWSISKSSGLIQLSKLVPLKILYPENHAGAVGKIWDKHHTKFSSFINQFQPKKVLEIGGAHGILSQKYQQFDSIEWTIIEPNPIPIEGVKAHYIETFFDNNFVYNEEYDAVIHSHVFEHIYEPKQFISHISGFMEEGKKLIFSVPNMEEMIKRNYTNCINFEHTILLTEDYIEFLLNQYYFKIESKEYFMEDHSIFYSCSKDSNLKSTPLNTNLYKKNKKLYLDYINYHKVLVSELNLKLKKINNTNIFLFGAHIFSQYLILLGLDSSKIKYLLDNDPNKQDKRLYGTEKEVRSPKILKNIAQPIIILKAGVYNEEIKKDILENINENTIFWE